jgi:mRNA-degrading endonuclease YafQ of YafQ-DinJ toxin-antitoxin module
VQVIQTSIFKKQVKKLHKNQKSDLDSAVSKIVANVGIGDFKKGDLTNIQVYKFKMVKQLTLLAYEVFEEKLQLVLIFLGSHENFYRDLKK